MTLDTWAAGLDYWLWMAFGLGLFALEILVSGFILLWFGIGAMVAGLLFIGLDLTLPQQGIVFSLLSVIALVVGRPILKRRLETTPTSALGLNRRGDALIGTTAVLVTPLDHGHGRVRLADGEWSVANLDVTNSPFLPAGSTVIIRAVDGNTLLVEPAPPTAP